jgi:hypothetical protein
LSTESASADKRPSPHRPTREPESPQRAVPVWFLPMRLRFSGAGRVLDRGRGALRRGDDL